MSEEDVFRLIDDVQLQHARCMTQLTIFAVLSRDPHDRERRLEALQKAVEAAEAVARTLLTLMGRLRAIDAAHD